MKDSNVYVVSPPTLHIPASGLSICLVSNDKAWQDEVIEMVEEGVQSDQLTFYANESGHPDPKAWIWYWHVVDNCQLVIVDMSTCSEHEIRMALAMCKLEHPVVFYVKPGNDEFITLLHAIQIPSFSDIASLSNLLESSFG